MAFVLPDLVMHCSLFILRVSVNVNHQHGHGTKACLCLFCWLRPPDLQYESGVKPGQCGRGGQQQGPPTNQCLPLTTTGRQQRSHATATMPLDLSLANSPTVPHLLRATSRDLACGLGLGGLSLGGLGGLLMDPSHLLGVSIKLDFSVSLIPMSFAACNKAPGPESSFVGLQADWLPMGSWVRALKRQGSGKPLSWARSNSSWT